MRGRLPKKVTLALDLGGCLGWAIFHGKRRYASGTIRLKQRTRRKIREPRAVKYIQFMDILHESCSEGDPIPLARKPDSIAYEHARGHWKTAAPRETYGAYLGQLEIFSLRSGIPIFGIPQRSLKKLATGNGNAGKDEIMRAAKKLWPRVKLQSHDEADALHVGRIFVEGLYEW